MMMMMSMAGAYDDDRVDAGSDADIGTAMTMVMMVKVIWSER